METIVFLPGLGCDERSFSHQLNKLKNNFNTKVIVCNSQSTMTDHIDYVLNNSPEKIILIGHSFGGWIAQWIAINAPEKVSKLILMGTGPGKLTLELKKIFEEMFFSFENNKTMEFFDRFRPGMLYKELRNDNALLNLIRTMQMDFPNEGLINQAKTDLEGKDTTEFLNKIQCETLLIHGRQDPYFEMEMAILKEHIPNNTYIEIDRCGHMIPIEQPEIVTNVIDHWLS